MQAAAHALRAVHWSCLGGPSKYMHRLSLRVPLASTYVGNRLALTFAYLPRYLVDT
jgi:hypothetical protein